MVRSDIPKPGDSEMCVWCGKGRIRKSLLWCSEECQQQYLSRSQLEALRQTVQERDINLCEVCGKFDPRYTMSPRYPAGLGGGAAGIDGVRTLCEQCLLDRMAEITEAELNELAIPDVMPLRKAWRAAGRRWQAYRYSLGPLIVSGLRWQRMLTDYKNGAHHLLKAASYRNRDHFRLLQVTLRWWKIVRKNSPNPHPLLVQTIESLTEQHRAVTVWAVHFRTKNRGVLD